MRRAAVFVVRVAVVAFFAIIDDAVAAVDHAACVRTLACCIGAVGEGLRLIREFCLVTLFIAIKLSIATIGIFAIDAVRIRLVCDPFTGPQR